MESIYFKKGTVPIVSIIAKQSNTGKTTLIEGIIKVLKTRNYSIGVLKHDAHKFEIDKEGKDSYRFSKAGADVTIVSSKDKLALIENLKEEKELKDIISMFGYQDLIIIEGYKNNDYPKIEVYRKEVNSELIYSTAKNKNSFVAIATNEALDINLIQLDINDIEKIAGFIEEKFIKERSFQNE
ncbi:molybdopterin-guanine dinucleotide biosynthesis protein B [Clostridium felsineum]|uniref:Molybdopterin-guanine dinucleotide biosynthesis adapter protein n=1 Tax=Clostridium felsineum TaxID=36839 RepID=A0A1S8L1A0_9CLOT|nr:molybdopterin-guanine dinucleotide biosynthesis protein B [Clostridium felsineum]MCR3760471.1 molybdopterin-guanine dinucleotide biosynthesis protein B [Clostridium felsineum]URZ08808.1 Molybdopterin-guanine dinucleotide biosynthesis adapter protein [Clostridium felsineum]URZ09436.1 Molybdopterin-guanine dinucleotide biosynthesis adapter protein [Clostridium felsineum]URZ14208.1 Molybdopterin-guanine dinucleotide biosynthesis adapter protein [Clostridium felsineum DSM 794]